MASGLQFVDENLDENHVVATAMKKLEEGTDEICAQALNEITENVVGASYVEVAHSTISDYAALGVADYFDHIRDGSDMHHTDRYVYLRTFIDDHHACRL